MEDNQVITDYGCISPTNLIVKAEDTRATLHSYPSLLTDTQSNESQEFGGQGTPDIEMSRQSITSKYVKKAHSMKSK